MVDWVVLLNMTSLPAKKRLAQLAPIGKRKWKSGTKIEAKGKRIIVQKSMATSRC